MTDKNTFDAFLRPQSVAIVGASPKPGNPRNTLVKVLLKHGFTGRVYPVSPSHGEVEGLPAYASLADLPETPDVALIITPAATVPGVIEECGAKGIGNAIVFSSGFEEVEGGDELARQLADAAQRHQVAVIGPNCNGVWSVRAKTLLTFSPAALRMDAVRHAPIAVISQSGALAGAIGRSLDINGIGCSYIVSVGNETALDVIDALEAIVEQDDVRVVVLYLEGLDQAQRLLPVAERARARGVQIVALKAGRSASGQAATASHTGKIASSHVVYADVFAQAGIIEVDSLVDALSAVEVLAYLPNPRVSGDAQGGVAIMSASGGAGALLADHSHDYGVPMATFTGATIDRLYTVLPAFARKENPIDLTGQINSLPNLFRDSCAAVAADPRTEAVIVQFSASGRRHLDPNADAFRQTASQVPVFLSFIGDVPDTETRQQYLKAGALLCADPSLATRSLAWLYQRERMQRLPKLPQRCAATAHAFPADWQQTMQLCSDSGITPAKWVILGPDDQAARACADLRLPLVVKVLPSESEHKTELGLVKLRVSSMEEVDALARAYRRQLAKPEAGILVQEMLSGGVEVVMSCLRNTDFGPVLAIGSGGVAVELYQDVVHLALPVSAEQVKLALRRLKLWTLLQGFRGNPPADVDALASAAVRFGDLFLASEPIAEFEMNPVLVRAVGEGVYTVDALVK
ncbi:acetate--CoA ligase family protein [Pseudomonas hunanensis]|uniref:acetate--CoA ligase family protein n=1 Tax=Pseudomonas hunanensis TaxID=1247546 RepID=UPI0038282EC0